MTATPPDVVITQYELKCQSDAGKKLSTSQIKNGIINEIQINRNYTAAEELFQDLLANLTAKKVTYEQLKQEHQKAFRYREVDVANFQRSIAKIVQQAPNPPKALHYANFLLKEVDPPLRDEKIENTVLIHLIKLYSRHGGDYLDKGLDFVKIGVERELARTPKTSRPMHYLPENAFEVTCTPILRYHQMKFSRNGLSLESWQPKTF
ncbi:hypothetical protein BDC45DRAFT_503172 [Circinella umbellata]|nr:hypothetical protein BDC45DRAFT_503172 [Circinella umbellata]